MPNYKIIFFQNLLRFQEYLHGNYFIISSIAFILGIHSYFVIDDSYLVICLYFLPFFVLVLFYFVYMRYLFLIYLFGVLIFYVLGTLTVILHSYFNNTILLQHSLFGKEITGKLVMLSSDSNKKNIVELQDVTIKSYKGLKLKRVIFYTDKAIYNYLKQQDLKSDIVFFGNLYASNLPLMPYGFNFKINDYFNQISAKGYIKKIINIKKSNKDLTTKNNYNIHQLSFYYNSFKENLFQVKIYLSSIISKFSVNSDSSNILKAVLLGEKLSINKDLKDSLSKSSLMHIITISGYHISFITLIIFFIIRKSIAIIPRINIYFNSEILAAISTIPIIFCYITLIGDKIPALRAYLMVVFLLLGIIFNKKIISLNNLFLVIICLLLFNPHYIYSLSFLLSVIATLSLFLIYNNIYFINFQNNWFQGRVGKVFRFFITIFIVSFCINFLINPLISHYFGFIPFLGFLANILVIPLFSFFIMPTLIGFMLFVIPFKSAAIFLLKLSNLGVEIMLKISYFFANFKFAYYEGNFLSYYGFFFYFSGLICLLLFKRFYKFIGVFCIMITYFFIFNTKKPDIIISNDFKIAFLLDSGYMLYKDSNNGQFLNFLNIKNTSITKFDKVARCDFLGCLVIIKNKMIVISNDPFVIVDDCKNGDLIIAYKKSINKKCDNKTLVIDRTYLNKMGSLYIFLDKENSSINIISNPLPLNKPWNKYFN